MRRTIVTYLILCLLTPISIEAKKKSFGNGLCWELSDNGTLTISGNGRMPDFEMYKTPWYSKKGEIKRIIIEKGITHIGNNSFNGKHNKGYVLNEISLPASLKTIGNKAFEECHIRHLIFPNGLQSIGDLAFSFTTLEEVILPNSVIEIGYGCFSYSRSLRKVRLSDGMKTIAVHAFGDCPNINEIIFSNNLVEICRGAFYYEYNLYVNNHVYGELRKLSIPNGVKIIGDEAFRGHALEIIDLPKSLNSIGKRAFARSYDGRFEGEIRCLPSFVNEENASVYGLSSTSVKRYLEGIHDIYGNLILAKKNDRIITNSGDGSYWIVKESLKKGVVNNLGKWIIPIGDTYSEILPAGNNYIKIKQKDSFGILTVNGKEIIPTSRGYTYIGDYDSSKGTFAFTKKGVSGVCDAQGREISTTKLAPTSDDIKANGGYASAMEMKNGSTKYYKVSKGGRYGLTDSEGKEIIPCEMEALESAGTGYLKYKINGFWGVMNYAGKIIIDTDRGYTSIGNFVTFTKRFPYTMNGYKGECDINGKQISKIKVDTSKQTVVSSSASSSTASGSSSNSNSNNNSGNKTTTVVVEHHRDPVPVQEWQACFGCGGMGTMGCDNCGGSGTKYIGDRLHRCSRCNGRGIIPCNICYGNKGKYVTVYR